MEIEIPGQVKTALVHHWLVTQRGGERVFEAMAQLFSRADIYTLVRGDSDAFPALRGRRIRTSLLQRLPRPARWYPYYLPLFPAATKRLNLTNYELVISSDAATVKGVHTHPRAVHICYCHAPLRYVWDGYDAYHRAAGPVARWTLSAVRNSLRRWDYEAARRVTHFVANSRHVQRQIKDCYNRESTVIYPPVDIQRFQVGVDHATDGSFYLLVSQLVPYKRADLVVEAFNQSRKPLVVIGQGPETRKLKALAKPNIKFLGPQPRPVVIKAMQQCRAFVFAGMEDFGISLAEAQACGKPVIAFAKGGASEIVQPGVTGILFNEQTADSLIDAIEHFELSHFDPHLIRASALRFAPERFLLEFSSFCSCKLRERAGAAWNRQEPRLTGSVAGVVTS